MSNRIRERANVGHGHVYVRPDGKKARCGGPNVCRECAEDQDQWNEDEEDIALVALRFPSKTGLPLSELTYPGNGLAVSRERIKNNGPSDWYSSGEEDGQYAIEPTEKGDK